MLVVHGGVDVSLVGQIVDRAVHLGFGHLALYTQRGIYFPVVNSSVGPDSVGSALNWVRGPEWGKKQSFTNDCWGLFS